MDGIAMAANKTNQSIYLPESRVVVRNGTNYWSYD